jgi:hypothetical protein
MILRRISIDKRSLLTPFQGRCLQSILFLLALTMGLRSLSTMAISSGNLLTVSTITCYLLGQFATARPCLSGWNSDTAIDGNLFPPLIEVTTEHLIRGYEMSWFTSVDVVQVLIFLLQNSYIG